MGKLVGVWWCRVFFLGLLIASGGCSSSDPTPAKPAEKGCVSDSDCDSGLYCNEQHECVQCRFDSQCAATQRCDLGQCLTRVSCDSAADCKSPAAAACDTQLHECFACVSANDCGPGKTCNSQHDCVEASGCANGSACPTGLVCSNGLCSDCASDHDCAATQRCTEHRCTASCASDKDCVAQGLLCDPTRRACVECVVTGDCPSSYHCGGGSCVLDVCQAGDTQCAPNAAAVSVCSPAGDRFITLFCADGQVCTDKGSGPRCSNWQCTPGVSQCSADGARVEQCNADGLSNSVTQQCGADQLCVGAQCSAITCAAGATFCKAGDVYQCNFDGTSASRVQQCGSTAYCDTTSVTCVSQVCTPGQMSCIGTGNQHGVCKGDGSGYQDLTDCAEGEVCSAGACLPLGCTASSSFCDGLGKVRACNSTGTASTVAQVCDAAHHCVQASNSATCSDNPCTPNALACSGNQVMQCKADGTGYTGSGTDCGATGTVCLAGACVPKQCDNGTLSCVSSNVFLCVDNGSAQQLYQACIGDQYCDTTSKSCKPRLCSPAASSCNGQIAATCNADGSGYLSAGAVDCAATGKVCSAGACAALSCTANQTFCQSGNVYKCNATGTSSTLSIDCYDPSQHCVKLGNGAQCVGDVCSDNAQTCSGNSQVKCNADGSGYVSTTDCADQVCVNGACLAKTCTPGSFACSGNVSTVCNATGTAYVTNQVCGSGTFCADGGKCVPLVCAPGAAACVANAYGVCNTTGSAEAPGGTNCLSSGQVCSTAGCVETATDSLSETSGNLYFSNGNVLLGAVIRASSDRILTSMQANLYTYAVGTLRLLGYVSDTQAGPYLPLFDTSIQLPKGAGGLVESVPLNVPIVAGKFYYFAEHFPSPTFYGDQTNSSRFLGLGRVVGTYSIVNISQPPQSITGVSTTGSVPDIRLVTQAP